MSEQDKRTMMRIRPSTLAKLDGLKKKVPKSESREDVILRLIENAKT